MNNHELLLKNFHPLKTNEDQIGSDLLAMSDFYNLSISDCSQILYSSPLLSSEIFSDIGIITEFIQQGIAMIKGNTMLIPDLESLPTEIKEKLRKGIYKIGKSKQVDGNYRSTIIDPSNNDTRVKDITLKEIKLNNEYFEAINTITMHLHLREISSSLQSLINLAMFNIDRDRDNHIKVPFLNARDYILKAQNERNLSKKKAYLQKAEENMLNGFNSIYTDLDTSSKHLVKSITIFNISHFTNAYMTYIQEDIMLITKMMGLYQNILFCLGEYESMKSSYKTYLESIKKLIKVPVYKDYSTIDLLQENYPYTKKNFNFWSKFKKKMENVVAESDVNKIVFTETSHKEINHEQN